MIPRSHCILFPNSIEGFFKWLLRLSYSKDSHWQIQSENQIDCPLHSQTTIATQDFIFFPLCLFLWPSTETSDSVMETLRAKETYCFYCQGCMTRLLEDRWGTDRQGKRRQWKWVFIYTLLCRTRSEHLLTVWPSGRSDDMRRENWWMEFTVVSLTGLGL